MSSRSFLKRSHRTVDQWLEKLGFYRKCIARDETCVFRIVSEQLYNTQTYHLRVRQELLMYLEKHRKVLAQFINTDFDEYMDKIRKHLKICDQVEFNLLSLLYRRDIIIFDPKELKVTNITERNLEKQFLFCKTAGDHYDGIFPMEHIETAAFCQAMVYELLYEKVFSIEDTKVIVDLMLHFDSENPVIETNNNCFTNQQQRIDAVKTVLAQNKQEYMENNLSNSLRGVINDGVAPFSFKVAKALDRNIYRNIEFDSWNEMRKEIRYNSWYKGGEDLTEGVRCLVKLSPGESLMCYIQKLSERLKNGGEYQGDEPCLVYIESLAQICTVRRDQLEPLPHAVAWPLPLKTYKHLYKENCMNKKNLKKSTNKQLKTVKACKVLDFSSDSSDNAIQPNYKYSKDDFIQESDFELIPMSQPYITDCSWEGNIPSEQGHIPGSPPDSSVNYSPYYYYEPHPLDRPYYESTNYNIPQTANNNLDVPLHDASNLRFFYNIGLQYFQAVNSATLWQPTSANPPMVPIIPPAENGVFFIPHIDLLHQKPISPIKESNYNNRDQIIFDMENLNICTNMNENEKNKINYYKNKQEDNKSVKKTAKFTCSTPIPSPLSTAPVECITPTSYEYNQKYYTPLITPPPTTEIPQPNFLYSGPLPDHMPPIIYSNCFPTSAPHHPPPAPFVTNGTHQTTFSYNPNLQPMHI